MEDGPLHCGKGEFCFSASVPLSCCVCLLKRMSKRVKFEVFGQVQGVFFRKYTAETARALRVTGWCENTPNGSVRGEIEGSEDAVSKMKEWLVKTGSPRSVIERCEFRDEVIGVKYHDFTVRR